MRTWAQLRTVATRVPASRGTLRGCRLLSTDPASFPTAEGQAEPTDAESVVPKRRHGAPPEPDALLQEQEPNTHRSTPWQSPTNFPTFGERVKSDGGERAAPKRRHAAPLLPVDSAQEPKSAARRSTPWANRLTAAAEAEAEAMPIPWEIPIEQAPSVLTLAQAITTADNPAIPRLWDTRRRVGPLAPGPAGGEALLEEFEAYTAMIKHAPLDQLDEPSIATLDDIAIHAAALGMSHGVRTMMDHHLTRKNPDRALDIALRLHRLIDERNSQLHAGSEGFAVSMHTMVLSRAVLACIAKDTFSPLLQMCTVVVVSGYVRPIHSPERWHDDITRAASTHGMKEDQALSWAQRLFVLSLLKLPMEEFESFVNTGSGSIPIAGDRLQLPQFIQSIIIELSKPDSHITVDPQAATQSDRTLLLFSPEHWASLVRALIRGRNLDPSYIDLENTLTRRLCEAYGSKPSVVDAAEIEGLTLLENFDEARRAWRALKDSQGEPGAAVYRAYIDALLTEGATEKALRTFEHFTAHIRISGVDPAEARAAASVFTTVIAWHAARNELDAAHAVLTHMTALDLPCDAAPYNHLLARYAEHADRTPFWALVRAMDTRGVRGDLETAALVLLAAHDAGARAPILAVARLVHWGLAHDTAACTALLQRLVRTGTPAALGAAERLLTHMRRAATAGRAPDRHAYALVLAGVERTASRDPDAAAALRARLARGLAQSGLVLEEAAGATLLVVRGCCEDPAPDGLARAVEYYRRYKDAQRQLKMYRPLWELLASEIVRRKEAVYVKELRNDCWNKQMRNAGTVKRWLHRMWELVRDTRRKQKSGQS